MSDFKSDLEVNSPYSIVSLCLYWEHRTLDQIEDYLHAALMFCPLKSNDDLMVLKNINTKRQIENHDFSGSK